jgi:hypothetical protein
MQAELHALLCFIAFGLRSSEAKKKQRIASLLAKQRRLASLHLRCSHAQQG